MSRDRLRIALEEIAANKGLCIYGTPELFGAADEVRQAFQLGSNMAYEQCAEIAERALAADTRSEVANG